MSWRTSNTHKCETEGVWCRSYRLTKTRTIFISHVLCQKCYNHNPKARNNNGILIESESEIKLTKVVVQAGRTLDFLHLSCHKLRCTFKNPKKYTFHFQPRSYDTDNMRQDTKRNHDSNIGYCCSLVNMCTIMKIYLQWQFYRSWIASTIGYDAFDKL